MTDKAWQRKISAELRRIGAGGVTEPAPGLPLKAVRFRSSTDGRLAQFSRQGCLKLIISRGFALPALRKVSKNAGIEAAWRSLNLAAE